MESLKLEFEQRKALNERINDDIERLAIEAENNNKETKETKKHMEDKCKEIYHLKEENVSLRLELLKVKETMKAEVQNKNKEIEVKCKEIVNLNQQLKASIGDVKDTTKAKITPIESVETIETDETIDLQNLANNKASGFSQSDPTSEPVPKFNSPRSSPVTELSSRCSICKVNRGTREKLEMHMRNHEEDGDYNCDDCSYQVNDISLLKKHCKETKHTSRQLNITPAVDKVDIACSFCAEQFDTKFNLMKHRKLNHPTFKPCANIDSCVFGDNCIYSHIPVPVGFHRCFQCGFEYSSKNEMMVHRKTNHENKQICNNFRKNDCRQTAERCWFLHVQSEETFSPPSRPQRVLTPPRQSPAPPQGFWERPANLTPPSATPDLPSITMMYNSMTSMMNMMSNMMNKMQTQ